jgi:membrane fusion protein, adhesin transport system
LASLGLLVTFSISTIERDGKAYPIIPGVICSVDIKTGRKTILSSLSKPINKARQEP